MRCINNNLLLLLLKHFVGVPAAQVEIILMATALDSHGDKEIDNGEFKKLRRKFKLAEFIRKAADLEY